MSDIVFKDVTNETEILKTLYGINDQDVILLKDSKEYFIKNLKFVIEDFYKWLKVQEDVFELFFADPDLLQTVKKLQTDFWKKLFSFDFDSNLLGISRQIGEIHSKINLPLSVYFAGMNKFHALFNQVISDEVAIQNKNEVSNSLSKFINLNTAIVADTYNTKSNLKIEAQNRALIEMSTPVTLVSDRILLLPIVGILDSKRTLDMMDSILKKISSSMAIVTLIDISGVAFVDTAVANHLIKVTQATKLMGCETIISGISPIIAHTIVDLGIRVGEIRTTATLKDALSMALEEVKLSQKRNQENKFEN